MNSVIKLDALTTLRFFAAAMIVVGHVNPLFGSFRIANNFALSQGVSFFFVLSGFILAYNYRSLPDGRSVKRFLIARFARIWPLHIVTLSIWIYLFYPNFIQELISSTSVFIKFILHALLLQSWSFSEPWIISFNGAAWSISTEAFFYIVFAFIFISPTNRLHKAMAVSMVILIIIVFLSTKYNIPKGGGTAGLTIFSVLYTNPVMRVFEFLFGVLCSNLFFRYRNSFSSLDNTKWLVAEIAAISISVYSLYLAARPSLITETLGTEASFYFRTSGIWYSWGVLILIFSLSRGPIARLLSIKPLVFLGEISFALYLIHISIYNYAYFYGDFMKGLGVIGVIMFWLACIAASSLLHLAVEKPCRKLIMKWWDKRASA